MRSGWAVYVYPLGFDVTADGSHMVYGYSNSSSCCPIGFAQGTYVRPVTNSALDPINISGQQHPTLFGSRVIAHAGATVNRADNVGHAVRHGLHAVARRLCEWTRAPPHRPRCERAARRARTRAVERRLANDRQDRRGGDPRRRSAAHIRCGLLHAGDRGRHRRLALSGRGIAWTDDQGLEVAGTPTTAADPCALTSPPVVISPTASQGAIGGANVAENGQDGGAGQRQGRADRGQGRPRGHGEDLGDRGGEDPETKGQTRRRRDRIGDRGARRDRDGEGAPDRRRAQAAKALEGRANDVARKSRRHQHHQACHAALTAVTSAVHGRPGSPRGAGAGVKARRSARCFEARVAGLHRPRPAQVRRGRVGPGEEGSGSGAQRGSPAPSAVIWSS